MDQTSTKISRKSFWLLTFLWQIYQDTCSHDKRILECPFWAWFHHCKLLPLTTKEDIITYIKIFQSQDYFLIFFFFVFVIHGCTKPFTQHSAWLSVQNKHWLLSGYKLLPIIYADLIKLASFWIYLLTYSCRRNSPCPNFQKLKVLNNRKIALFANCSNTASKRKLKKFNMWNHNYNENFQNLTVFELHKDCAIRQ